MVGAPLGSAGVGSVYVYDVDDSSSVRLLDKLSGDTGHARFGTDVAITQLGKIVVGAPR